MPTLHVAHIHPFRALVELKQKSCGASLWLREYKKVLTQLNIYQENLSSECCVFASSSTLLWMQHNKCGWLGRGRARAREERWMSDSEWAQRVVRKVGYCMQNVQRPGFMIKLSSKFRLNLWNPLEWKLHISHVFHFALPRLHFGRNSLSLSFFHLTRRCISFRSCLVWAGLVTLTLGRGFSFKVSSFFGRINESSTNNNNTVAKRHNRSLKLSGTAICGRRSEIFAGNARTRSSGLNNNFMSCSFIKILVNISDPFAKMHSHFPRHSLPAAWYSHDVQFPSSSSTPCNPLRQKKFLGINLSLLVVLNFLSFAVRALCSSPHSQQQSGVWQRGDKNSLNYLSCILMSEWKWMWRKSGRLSVVVAVVSSNEQCTVHQLQAKPEEAGEDECWKIMCQQVQHACECEILQL